MVEAFADGVVSATGLAWPRRAARAAGKRAGTERAAAEAVLLGEDRAAWPHRGVAWDLEQLVQTRAEQEAAAWLAWRLVGGSWDPEEAATQAAEFAAEVAGRRGEEPAERAAQCDLLRDLFGNPFRHDSLSPAVLAWNGGIVVRLAQAAYDERQLPEGTLDNGRLAVLADALEEAGCADAAILSHCRSGGEHVRGCWVIDLLLGKS